MEHSVQPRPGSHADKLWKHNTDDVDPEPVFARESVPLCLIPVKAVKRSSVSRPAQPVKYNLSHVEAFPALFMP